MKRKRNTVACFECCKKDTERDIWHFVAIMLGECRWRCDSCHEKMLSRMATLEGYL